MPSDESFHVKELSAQLVRYGQQLGSLLAKIRPAEAANAREFFSSLSRGDGAADAVWGWVNVLLHWPLWRPAALERRLTLPPAESLERVANACRSAAENAESEGRRWLQFAKPGRSSKDVLIEAADLLDAVRNPDPVLQELAAELVPAGQAVDRLIDAVPRDWIPARLATLVAHLKKARSEVSAPLPLALGPWTPALASLQVRGEVDAQAAARWAGWLRLAGSDWFHDLAALAQSSREAADWLEAICAGANVQCFPAISSPSGALSWPAGVTLFQPGLTIRPGTPPGVIKEVERFSASPEAARFTMFSGDDAASPLAAALAAWQQASDAKIPLVCTALANVIQGCMRSPAPPIDVNVLAVLDELVRVEPQTPGLEPMLEAVRAWAATGGWSIIPEGPPVPGEGLAVKTVFKRDVPTGEVVRLKSFGLRGADGVVRGGEVVVSAGPPPHGLTDLEAAADGAPGAAGEELREAFRGLRTAGANGYLEFAAIDLYTLFWDRLRTAWAEGDAATAETFASDLTVMMRETFNLHAFNPANYRDHPPDWVQLLPGTRMTTGRVIRVLRPGLTSNGELRLPARVAAE